MNPSTPGPTAAPTVHDTELLGRSGNTAVYRCTVALCGAKLIVNYDRYDAQLARPGDADAFHDIHGQIALEDNGEASADLHQLSIVRPFASRLEWSCNRCDRRMLVITSPGRQLMLLDHGDAGIVHEGDPSLHMPLFSVNRRHHMRVDEARPDGRLAWQCDNCPYSLVVDLDGSSMMVDLPRPGSIHPPLPAPPDPAAEARFADQVCSWLEEQTPSDAAT